MDMNQVLTLVGVALGVILVAIMAIVPFVIDRPMGPDMDEPDLPGPTPLHPRFRQRGHPTDLAA
jgi:hypothetical protein